MKRFLGLVLIAILLLSATAQENTPAGFERWTPAALQRFDQKLHADAAEDPHHFAVEQLADFPNDSFLLVHREADGQVEWHETQVDAFFVQSGSAKLLLGGKMINAETVGPHEKRNGSIEGGVRVKLSAGDVVRIPPRIPHQLLLDGSHEFNYFVVKVKGY
jgi:mannose-6-phosphate isomerase-like protein (cupin superfamily)